MDVILANLIKIIHICVILFVVIIPFTGSPYLLLLHSVFIPFLLLHWVTNDNTCVLTTLEKHFRGIKTKEEEKECITCNLINPIFGFKKSYSELSFYIYCITIGMWLLSISRLGWKYKTGEITKIKDLFLLK